VVMVFLERNTLVCHPGRSEEPGLNLAEGIPRMCKYEMPPQGILS